IAGSHVDKIRFGIVCEAIPNGSTASILIEVTSPGFRGDAHRLILKTLRRIAWNCVEAPLKVPRLCVDSNELATRGLVATRRPDDYLPAGNTSRHGPRVLILRIHDAAFQNRLAGERVQRE